MSKEWETLEDLYMDLHHRDLLKSDLVFECSNENKEWFFSLFSNSEGIKDWVDNSENTNLPPDIISKSKDTMIEVMVVNDLETIETKNGKYINSEMAHLSKEEKQSLREIREFAEKNDIILIEDLSDSEIEVGVHHNFKSYVRMFNRVTENHVKNIKRYRKNYSREKLVFLIRDESSSYYTLDWGGLFDSIVAPRQKITKHFLDSRFTSSFINQDIDLIIWYSPYKLIPGAQKRIHTIVVIDPNHKDFIDRQRQSNLNNIISWEL